MNYSQSKYRIVTNKLNFFALLLFIFWLPLNSNYLPIIISFWIFTWILEGNIKEKFFSFSYRKLYVGFLIYFFLTIISLFYTIDFNDGLFDIQEKLSIAFFPIILAGSNEIVKKHYKTILLVFVLANLIASIYCLSDAFFSNLIIENGTWYIKYWHWYGTEKYSFWQQINMRISNFSGSLLSSLMHPSYFSMYILFSIVILFDFYRSRIVKTIGWKIIVFFIIIFFIIMIYFLQSRAGLIAFLITAIFIILYEMLNKRKKRLLFIGIIIITLGSTFLFTSTRMQKVAKQALSLVKHPEQESLQEKDARFHTWFAATEVIKENFWFGTAPANLYKELGKKYEQHNLKKANDAQLNAHNQYLETFAGLGIFGFLSLIFILVYGFYFAYKKKHYLLFFLLVILSINFMFESMLNRMAGVLFMMFFYSLFVFMKQFREEDK
ncbi:MAG: O-antigen ligase family protein [Bacteroidota bacterium]